MSAPYQSISDATIAALAEQYENCDHIEIGGGRVNGETVPRDAYAALVERVRINANLLDDRFGPGAASQVLIGVAGQKRDFHVTVGPGDSIDLRLRK